MKARALIIACVALLIAPAARAQTDEQDHAAHHPQAAQPAEKGATSDRTAQGQADVARRVQENMQKMNELMARSQQTTDPAERQRVLDQHLQAMREQMQLLRQQRQSMGQGMMAGGMMMGQGGPGTTGQDRAGGGAAMMEEQGQDENATEGTVSRPGSADGKGMMKRGMGMMGQGVGMPGGASECPMVVIVTGRIGMMGPGMGMIGSGAGMMGPGMGMMGGDMMQMMHGMMHRDELLQQRVNMLEDMMRQLIEREAAGK
jgi:hypothetical protein